MKLEQDKKPEHVSPVTTADANVHTNPNLSSQDEDKTIVEITD